MGNPLASIIINNYNYGKYVCSAIDSALRQSYDNVEVIVVDDGSTDNSHTLIREYGNQIKSIFKPNGGQASAYNAGFSASEGDVVAFLDADDLLHENAINYSVLKFRNANVAKVQFPLEIIDDEGKACGVHIPACRMPSGDVLDVLLRYGGYGSPPASGNVYRRMVLNEIMPITESEWRIAADTVPVIASPFFGEVRSIDKALGWYRVHNNGEGKRLATGFSRPGNSESLSAKIEAFLKMESYLKELCEKHEKSMQVSVMQRNPPMLKTALSFKILEPDHKYNKEYTKTRLVMRGISASIAYPLYSGFHKLGMIGWFVLVGVAPMRIRRELIRLGLQPVVRGFNIK